jgi:hypothetical protein
MKAKQIAAAVSTLALALAATSGIAADSSQVRAGDENDASWIYVPAKAQPQTKGGNVRVQKSVARQIDENGTTSSYVTRQN